MSAGRASASGAPAPSRPPMSASKSAAASAAGGAPGPARSPEEREKEMQELLEKLKAASRDPEHATRRVRDLDRIVSTLRKHRSDCAAAIDADQTRLRDLDKQESLVRHELGKLESRLSERESAAERIREQIRLATDHLGSFVSSATQRVVATRVTAQQQQRKRVTEQLKVERGYSVDPADKTHLQVPQSMRGRVGMGATK